MHGFGKGTLVPTVGYHHGNHTTTSNPALPRPLIWWEGGPPVYPGGLTALAPGQSTTRMAGLA